MAITTPPVPKTSSTSEVVIIAGLFAYAATFIYIFEQPTATTMAWWAYLSAFTSACLLYSVLETGLFSVDAARVVCFAYWHRSVFMHCTVERDCLWDMVLCSPLWGRTVACVGEVAMVYLVFHAVVPKRATLYCGLIAAAECISFFGVVTRQYWWFMVENGTWAVVALLIAASIALQCSKGTLGALNDIRRLKVLSGAMFGALFLYNVFVDLPMYHARSVELDGLEGRSLSLLDGVANAAACHQVTVSDEVWRPQMVWMGLNYTLAPVACLYVAATVKACNCKAEKVN